VQIITSHPISGRAKAATLAALAGAALIAGCGSSKPSNEIAPGNENANAAAEVAKLEKEESTSTTSTTSTSSTATTPTSGALSKKPKVTVPSGPAPSKLETKEIIEGTGPEAKSGETVTVNYVGVLYKNGKEFDSSWKRSEPFTFALGKKQVIEGWDKGVAGMHVGGRRELIIPASEGYGKNGSPPSIPGNEALVFVVDLLGV